MIPSRALVSFLSLALAVVVSSPLGAEVVFSFAAVPGTASQSRIVSIPKSGCYGFKVESTGTATLSLVDRMYGRIAGGTASGDPSSGRSARFSAFLESGEYKLLLSKANELSASATVERFPETELAISDAEAGRVRDLKLADGQAMSFTVKVSSDRKLRFFAMGRSLSGAKLFRAGGWAADQQASSGTLEVEKGKPVRYAEFYQDADPGEYRIVLWGEAAQPWANEGVKDDLYVVLGERRYDEIGLFDLTLGSSGIEFLSIPGSVSFAQATVSGDAKILLSWAYQRGSRLSSQNEAATDPRGGYKAATLSLSTSADRKWLVVRGKSGQRLSLRFFPAFSQNTLAQEYRVKAEAEAAFRALGSVEGEDAVPFTARVYALQGDGYRVSSIVPVVERTLPLSGKTPIRLKANVLERCSFLISVEESGKYAVLEKEAKKASANWTFYPMKEFSFNWLDAQSAKSGDTVRLDAGKYLLVLDARNPGALDAVVAKSGLDSKLGGMGLWKLEPEASGNAISWYGIALPETGPYRRTAFAFGDRAGVYQGYSIRTYPVALSEQPFSVRVEQGQTVRYRSKLEKPSYLRLSGPAARVSVNGAALDESRPYPAGDLSLSVAAADGKEAWICLEAVPVSDAPPAEQYAACREGAPSWTEFDRNETKRFLLSVDAPALYTLSTTGRLDTSIMLRSRMRASFAKASDGGPGRNARVSAYLKAGEYLVEVSASGASKGAAGIALERRPLRALAPLREAGRVRGTAEEGEALAVPVVIPEAGNWRVASAGLGRSFSYRIEDKLGWPIGSPVSTSSYSGFLEAGDYRFISLEDPVSTRRVFTLERLDGAGSRADPYSPEAVAAAKSFPVRLGQSYQRSWRGEGADEAVLNLAAPVRVTLSLSSDMSYRLTLPDLSAGQAGLGADGIVLDLPAGKTSVRMTPILADQDHGYSVRFDCPDLMENRPLSIQAGSVVPLSVGRAGNWELETSGGRELEAALFEKRGGAYRLVAVSRSIPDDWNCLVSAPLEAGRYVAKFAAPGDPRLVEPPKNDRFGSSSGDSRASLRFRSDALAQKKTGAFSLSADLASDFIVVDYTAERTGPYRFAVDAADPAELFVEKGGSRIAYGKTEAFVSLAAGNTYRVRCARSGDGSAKVTLSCVPVSYAERSLSSSDELESGEQAALVRDGEGLSRVADGTKLGADVLIASGLEKQFAPASAEPFRADGAWLLRSDGRALGRVALQRASVGASLSSLLLPLNSEGQKIAVGVAEGSVALVSVASRGFEASLTESFRRESPAAVDWFSASVSAERSVLGLSAGERAVTVRDSRPRPDGRLVPVSVDAVPVAGTEKLSAGESRTFTIGAGSALSLSVDGGRSSAFVSLEKGLAAFAASGRTTKTAAAFDESGTFLFESVSGSLYLVNPGDRPAIASVEAVPKAASLPAVAERDGYEEVSGRGKRLSLRVDGRDDASELSVSGDIASFRFFDEESGVVFPGTIVETAAGPMITAPARKGRLELELRPGYVKAFLARSEDRVEAFVESAKAASGFFSGTAALGAGQALSGADAKKFSVDGRSGALLSAASSGPGVLAILDPKGRVVSASAALSGQEALAVMDGGQYSVFVRPFKADSRTGSLTAAVAVPETVAKSGPLSPRLAGEGRLAVYRFAAAGGLVGAGVRAERDGLRVRLLDSALAPIAEGPLLIRRLEQGGYYLVVSSEAGTVRYQPVLFGLEGSKVDVPDDVVARYLKNGEEE